MECLQLMMYFDYALQIIIDLILSVCLEIKINYLLHNLMHFRVLQLH